MAKTILYLKERSTLLDLDLCQRLSRMAFLPEQLFDFVVPLDHLGEFARFLIECKEYKIG